MDVSDVGSRGPDRWVNAVIELRVPMETPVTASAEEKLAEVASVYDFLAEGDGTGLFAQNGAVCRWEDVENGEPINETRADTPASTKETDHA